MKTQAGDGSSTLADWDDFQSSMLAMEILIESQSMNELAPHVEDRFLETLELMEFSGLLNRPPQAHS